MSEYTTIDIQRMLNIERQRLREWIDKEFIFPRIQRASGVGTKNIFSRWDLYGIEMFKQLIETGFSRLDAKLFYLSWSNETQKTQIEDRHLFNKAIITHSLAEVKDLGITGHFSYTYFVKENEEENYDLWNLKHKNMNPNERLVRWDVVDIKRIIDTIDKKI